MVLVKGNPIFQIVQGKTVVLYLSSSFFLTPITSPSANRVSYFFKLYQEICLLLISCSKPWWAILLLHLYSIIYMTL